LVTDRERSGVHVSASDSDHDDLELLLRRVIREETGLTPVAPAAKWRGGTLVLRPGTPGLQEKSWPIETFFHKIVMLRNRLRTLEQQVNASDLPDDVKIKLQGYVSGCYGSLTSFNVLFADDADQFKGGGGDWTDRLIFSVALAGHRARQSTANLCLSGRAPHILRPWTFRSLPDVELDAVTLTQIVESLAIHRTLMKKILLPGIVLDEPKSLVDS
jgi:hypothetical protein